MWGLSQISPQHIYMISKQTTLNLALPKPKTPRSSGVHVSGIIRCIATEAGILKSEWAEELSLVDARAITDPTAILRISVGLAWEEFYIPTYLGPLGVVDHPGEMCLDDIYLTHDAEDVSVIITDKGVRRSEIVCHEVKATWKSLKTVGDMSGQWMWLTQIKAYCKALNTRHAKIHVLFMCGDYKFPISPQLVIWDLAFSDKEIDDNWELLRDYRDHRLKMEAE